MKTASTSPFALPCRLPSELFPATLDRRRPAFAPRDRRPRLKVANLDQSLWRSAAETAICRVAFRFDVFACDWVGDTSIRSCRANVPCPPDGRSGWTGVADGRRTPFATPNLPRFSTIASCAGFRSNRNSLRQGTDRRRIFPGKSSFAFSRNMVNSHCPRKGPRGGNDVPQPGDASPPVSPRPHAQ